MITSFFRRSSLWKTEEQLCLAKLREKVSGEIEDVKIEIRFLVDSNRPLEAGELKVLKWLLTETFEPESFSEQSMLDGEVFEVGPRLAIVTPKSTNAVSICYACGLNSVTRIEQTRRFRIEVANGARLRTEHLNQIYTMVHDKMTEEPYTQSVTTFEPDVKVEPVQLLPVLEKGTAALRQANKELGLAFDQQMMDYILTNYRTNKRNPTDVELFMFGQLNSEHCRHHRFNGRYIIDGKEMEDSLFGMIKSTTQANPANVVSAYSDNAAILSGRPITAFVPTNPVVSSAFRLIKLTYSLLFKVETHNHPTTICAFPGAATGTGGVIRDWQGAGRGGIPAAGLACYNVGNLLIGGYDGLPWEKEYAPHPRYAQRPLEIIIQASNGASDYGNKFGQPIILGSFTAFEQIVDGDHYGWKKTCMVAGGGGFIDAGHAEKLQPQQGQLVVQIGGDAYRIGLGGGSGSSKDAGSQAEELDFDSVQRDNAEMENRMNEVIRACSELGDKTPIITITDLGAGGECVALPEIVDPVGAHYELRQVPCGDKTMPVYVLWCNESQERMVMVVSNDRLKTLRQICERNRCPMYVVGEITDDGKLVVTDSNAPDDASREQKTPIDVSMKFLLADLPRMTIDCKTVARKLSPLRLPEALTVAEALERVLRLPKVASKHFLTRKVDRSVGGLIARQQTVGPLQLTLADCAVTADNFFSTTGMATAIGEQPIKGLVSTQAGGRMSLGESLTNIVWALVDGFESINFSATWQWPCRQPGEDARLYDAVKAVAQLCKDLKLRIPVGKDSVSMTAETLVDGKKHCIKCPGTVQMVSFAPCPDITSVVTPDIKKPGESELMLIDLSDGRCRLGGSALAQVYEQIGSDSPDVDDPALLRKAFEAVQCLIGRNLILAGHDRSDGGLITCLLEMAFAGNCGLDIDLNDRKVGENDHIAALFSEELGMVIEYLPENEEAISGVLKRHGLEGCCHVLGKTKDDRQVSIRCRGKNVLEADMRILRNTWQETSYQLDKLQANPVCTEAERVSGYERKGLSIKLSFAPKPTPKIKLKADNKPRVAVLREEGTNGHREMAGAFFAAGFESWDVTMTDLADGRITLRDFRGVAFSGGFSFADVLDAGKGWAGVIKFNDRIRRQFDDFIARPDTFSLGVCNGCQVMTLLGWVPWQGIDATSQPRNVRNESGIFESRFVAVRITSSPSIFLRGMEGSVLGVWVAHAEGRCLWPDEAVLAGSLNSLTPIRFVDDEWQDTQMYPFNPNGSKHGITALCSPDGRHLALMPHPERLFMKWQWPYWPESWAHLNSSPWLKLFQNARQWCEDHST